MEEVLMARGKDTGHDPRRQVNSASYLDRIPHPASTRQVERDVEPEDKTDYEAIHLSRQLRREPEGDTW
jgi:hypothetical protein